MNKQIFTLLLPDALTVNTDETKTKIHDKYQKFLKDTFGLKGNFKFPKPDKLWGRVFCFNYYNNYETRDVQNILKPLFLMLEDYVYPDHKQIMFF
ncbi:MAG: hypothetical protein GY862_23190, partial [Gammaproteobacteria bacterium]|nr:hypothetical protein [Gammaproteobacteria bacterium]